MIDSIPGPSTVYPDTIASASCDDRNRIEYIPITTLFTIVQQHRVSYCGSTPPPPLTFLPRPFVVWFFLTMRSGSVRFFRTVPHRTILPFTNPHRAARFTYIKSTPRRTVRFRNAIRAEPLRLPFSGPRERFGPGE